MRNGFIQGVCLLAVVVACSISLSGEQRRAAVSGAVVLRQTAYLKASNAEAGDHFGCGGELDGHAGQGVAVSADGNTLAIAAPHEASAAAGINGNQHDETMHGAGAVYVLTRTAGGWAQEAYLKASNPGESDEFGHYVALSADGNTLAVSAYFEASGATGVNGNQHDESVPQAGAVYVFSRQGTAWSQQAYIKASNTGEPGVAGNFGDGDQFGFSMTLSDDGNTLAVGAIAEDSGGVSTGINTVQTDNSQISAGAVYVFARTGTTWAQQAYVKPFNTDGGDMFGYSVSLSADGGTLAVGSFDEDGSTRQINGPDDDKANGAGAVYVFTRTGTGWTQQAYIKASNGETADSLGVHVELSDDGNTLAVGSLDEDCIATGINPPGCDDDMKNDVSTGAVYVYVRSGRTWTQQAFLKASNTGTTDWYGSRHALSGDGNTLAVAASLEDSASKGIGGKQDDDSADEAGAVYFYTRTGATWTHHAYVKGSNTEAYDEFGSAIALSRDGKTMLVSARAEDSAAKGLNGDQADNTADEAGAVYLFAIRSGS